MTELGAAGPTGDIEVGEIDVLVVGGGPVGLAMSADLGSRGLRVLTVDAGDGAVNYPTAESIDARSMEWLRQLGIVQAVERSGFPDDYPRDIAFVTRLAGAELARFRRPGNRERRESTGGLSPEGPAWWPKFWFDIALRERAMELPSVHLRYQWRCVDVAQSERAVSARLVGADGGVREVRARYLVACDGARSTVRRAIGVTMQGTPAEAVWEGAFVQIPDLLDRIDLEPAAQFYALRPRRAIFGSLNGKDLWRVTYPLRESENPTPDEVVSTIRDGIGVPDIPVAVRDARLWSGHTVVASRYRHGRVFLAGDAAHQMWPSGGHGMNTGIGDVHNLGWKLAATLTGDAGVGLLDSYEAERRPVAVRNTARAAANYQADLALPTDAELDEPGPTGDLARERAATQIRATREREWRSLGVQLGYRYEDSPVVVADGSPEPPDEPTVYEPTCRPGHRAPHAYLPDGRSTLDLFGAGFVLLLSTLSPAPSQEWINSFAARGAALTVVDISRSEAADLYPADLVLVRPDGFIAWSGKDTENAANEVAAVVLGLATAQDHAGVSERQPC